MSLVDVARMANDRLRVTGVTWRFRDISRTRVLRIAEIQLELFPLKRLKRLRKRRRFKLQVVL